MGKEGMIRIGPGDLVVVSARRRFYYALVLDRIALFGGQLCFVLFRTSAELLSAADIDFETEDGFYEIVDFIWAKREGRIQRIASKIPYAKAMNGSVQFFKTTFTVQGKANEWWIRDRDGKDVKRTNKLTEEEKRYPLHHRIDDAYLIDLVDQMWRPEKDPRI